MSTPRNVCHRCRHKWKVKKGKEDGCPKCGAALFGPTDPAPSMLGRIAVVLVLALVGAWYFDLLPGSAKDALEDAKDAVESTVEDVKKEVESNLPKEDPTPAKTPKKTATPRHVKKKKPKPATEDGPVEDGPVEAKPEADVAVVSKSGVLLGSAYIVKGKVTNRGTARAKDVRVLVTYKDATGAVIAEMEAEVDARALAPSQWARYESAVADDVAKRTESFSVVAEFETD